MMDDQDHDQERRFWSVAAMIMAESWAEGVAARSLQCRFDDGDPVHLAAKAAALRGLTEIYRRGIISEEDVLELIGGGAHGR